MPNNRVRSRNGDILSFLSHSVPLLDGVGRAALLELASHASLRNCPAGQFVCRSGERAHELAFVREGQLCVHQSGPGGNLQCIDLMMPGDVSGLVAVASPVFLWDVVASRDAVLIVIPREPFLGLIAKNPAVARAVLHSYGRRLRYVETLLYYSRERVLARLIVALIYLHRKFGPTLPFTRTEFGQLAGTTAETAMRTLRGLEEEKLLERHRGKIVIKNIEGLKACVGPEASRM